MSCKYYRSVFFALQLALIACSPLTESIEDHWAGSFTMDPQQQHAADAVSFPQVFSSADQKRVEGSAV
eukprot:2972656-Rhodomonas_salina.2